MQAGIIINPVAGRHSPRRVDAYRRQAEAALSQFAIDGAVRLTEQPGSARAIARTMLASGATTVVAWGGDGTINEVAAEVVAAEGVLGVVRGGSGNGFADGMGLERRPEDALRTALTGTERRIDTGMIDGRRFVNVAGIGFDAHLAGVFNNLTTRGPTAYFRAGLRELLTYRSVRYTVRTADTKIETAAHMLAIANCPTYGAGMMIAPGARADDGLLDLVVVPERSLPWILWHLPYLFAGRLDRVPGMGRRPLSTAVITGNGPLVFHVDGEVHAAADESVEVRVSPLSLRLRVPANLAARPVKAPSQG